MTDLPELIANVYRACGKDTDAWDRWGDADDIGLDAFVRDIVPTLNERGWYIRLPEQMPSTEKMFWECLVYHAPRGDEVVIEAETPVEACFRAAYEALKDD